MIDNRYYGHATLLRQYCGLSIPMKIPGRLQHGWMPGGGLHPQYLQAPYPKFIWSRRNLEEARRERVLDAVPIASPFLYLPPAPPSRPTSPKSILAFPIHGTDRDRLGEGWAAYVSSLEALEREGFGPITVCLYYLEHEDPVLRELFTSRGFTVVTAGPRNDNSEFLPRLRDFILRHAFVTANRIGTSALYSLTLGRPFFVYGWSPRFSNDEERLVWERSEFRQLAYESFKGDVFRSLGEEELGLEFKLEPEVLRQLFGWSPSGLPLHAIRFAQHLAYVASRRLRRIPPP